MIPLILVSGLASGQMLEEVVVTGSRADGGYDYYSMPAVTVARKADFLVQNIRLVNDSRSPDLRKQEIVETIENLIARSKRMQGMALSYGTGFLEPINLDDESLQLIEDRQRIDTSYVDIYAKVAFDKDADSKKQIAALREFIDGVAKAGRTEILPLGDIGLSIVGPEQYRYEIISRIAAENDKVREAIGASCKLSIAGLEQRVEWERTSVSELTLYIPYSLRITDCGT